MELETRKHGSWHLFCASFYHARMRMKLFLEREGLQQDWGLCCGIFGGLEAGSGREWREKSVFDVCQDLE
jgi:hypothetical protein